MGLDKVLVPLMVPQLPRSHGDSTEMPCVGTSTSVAPTGGTGQVGQRSARVKGYLSHCVCVCVCVCVCTCVCTCVCGHRSGKEEHR